VIIRNELIIIMAKKKRAGRPKGSKNKSNTSSDLGSSAGGRIVVKKRGRPTGSGSGTGKRRGRPAGSNNKSKGGGGKRGRPAKNNSSLLAPGDGSVKGIHWIGNTLVIDTRNMNVDEVVFLGKAPKVR
jgi:hypothetical protein